LLDELVPRARARLTRLALYPRPLHANTKIVVWPWFFRLPWYSRYVAYTLMRRVILSETPDELARRNGLDWLENLLVHELCHVWQVQHHPLGTALAHLRYRYRENPFEIEAREAARTPAIRGSAGR
jgi:hypothetical protein